MAMPTKIKKFSAFVPIIHNILIISSESGLSPATGSSEEKSTSPSESNDVHKCDVVFTYIGVDALMDVRCIIAY